MPLLLNGIYLLVPNESNQRVLHPGRVAQIGTQSGDDQVVIEFDKAISPPPGSDVHLFFELGGKFLQQGAKIVAVREPEPSDESRSDFAPRQIVVFKHIGNPMSAETRRSDRVSLTTQDIVARIGNEPECRLVDISAEGFGAITTMNCRIGEMMPIDLQYEGEHLDGCARVQTVKRLRRTKFRCGFFVPSSETQMLANLGKLTSTVRRIQLQRLRHSA